MWQKGIPLRKISSIIKKSLITLWLILIIGCGFYFLTHPWFFTVDSLRIFLEQFWSALLIIYLLLSALRGFTLIPSLPFVLVWVVLFPDNLYFVFVISLIGILLSSTMVYFFSREMGFEEILLRKYPHGMKRYEKWIQSYWFLTVALWSCIIVVPTRLDLLYCMSSSDEFLEIYTRRCTLRRDYLWFFDIWRRSLVPIYIERFICWKRWE